MPPTDFPLRWESTGDQWWYASPIDWAAANGHYDLVRELLLLDPNLLIKLTSLRRIRRLETVWDDDPRFSSSSKCRSSVARNLLLHCQTKTNSNSLIRAGYGGWLMYTAASAGDLGFVRELLERDPMMVFGEGEYGVSDVLYAAARSRVSEVFRVLFDLAVAAPGAEVESSVFRREMVNRGVHAAARGGDLMVLRELMGECEDVLEYRDGQGSTVLHSAAGRGLAEVVKDLVASFDIINSIDNQGNSSLHVAAFRGHLPVVEALLQTSPSSSSSINYAGDTFLHMAVAGFRTTGFRRLDKQMELMKQLVCGTIINIQEITNIRNNEGRTVLHMAMIGNIHANLVELLMTVPSINLNIVDIHGMTPLDLLNQCPRTALSMILIKQLISAGGSSNSKFHTVKSATASQVKMQGNGSSPGTSFTIPDAEIFRYTGVEALEDSDRPSSSSSASRSENQDYLDKKRNSLNRAARRLKIILGWWRSTETQSDTPKKHVDDDSIEARKKLSDHDEIPTPLRQRSSQASSLVNNKRTLPIGNSIPTHATKNEYTSGLIHGVFQSMPHMDPPNDFTNSISVSLTSINPKGVYSEIENGVASCSKSSVSVNGGKVDNVPQKLSSMNSRLINQYLCFGSQGLAVHNPIRRTRSAQLSKHLPLSVA